MFGFNDMNTNVPNPFATDTRIVLRGAGRRKVDTGSLDFVRREREMNNKKLSKKYYES